MMNKRGQARFFIFYARSRAVYKIIRAWPLFPLQLETTAKTLLLTLKLMALTPARGNEKTDKSNELRLFYKF